MEATRSCARSEFQMTGAATWKLSLSLLPTSNVTVLNRAMKQTSNQCGVVSCLFPKTGLYRQNKLASTSLSSDIYTSLQQSTCVWPRSFQSYCSAFATLLPSSQQSMKRDDGCSADSLVRTHFSVRQSASYYIMCPSESERCRHRRLRVCRHSTWRWDVDRLGSLKLIFVRSPLAHS